MNGLDISLEQFKNLKSKDRDELMYKNILSIKSNQTDNKFHNKIQYAWLSVLTLTTSVLLGIRKYLPI